MAAHVTCPVCGARNAAGAPWCGQCYTPFRSSDQAEEKADETFGVGEHQDTGQLELLLPPAKPQEPTGATWTCRVCDAVNPIEETNCWVCGLSIFESFEPKPEPVDAAQAVRRAILLPGFGHAAAGQSLLGGSIALLVVLSLLFGVMLLVSRAVSAGVTLVILAIGVWAVSILDAYRWSRGETSDVLLRPRIVTMLVGVLVTVIIIAAVSAQGRVNR